MGKKNILIYCLVAFSILLLVGCKGPGITPTDDNAAGDDEGVVISEILNELENQSDTTDEVVEETEDAVDEAEVVVEEEPVEEVVEETTEDTEVVEEEPVEEVVEETTEDTEVVDDNATEEVSDEIIGEDTAETEEGANTTTIFTSSADKIFTVNEGDLVDLKLKATDPDGDPLEITYTEPLDEDGKWQTEDGDAGEYYSTVTVSDGSNVVKQTVLIRVLDTNLAPTISGLEDLTVDEGATITLNPVVSDPDGDTVSLKYSGWMSSSLKTTTNSDVGEHTVTVTASDGEKESSVTITITVNDVNQAPVITW